MADCRRLARDAQGSSLKGARPRISSGRRDWIIELAFLRGFLAWEGFVEESCLLFMLGENPLRGRALVRYVSPPNRKAAMAMAAGGRRYASWDDPTELKERAATYFRSGRPFADALSPVHALSSARTVRNAIAHDSDHAHEKFRKLVRSLIGNVPPGVTVGKFLNTLRPGVTPSQTFLEYYLQQLELTAEQIARPN